VNARAFPGPNRRAFLRGGLGISVALPFLESLPERSAWAAEAPPVFSLFVCTANGVIRERFFPDELGPISAELLTPTNKATRGLARHAANLLFVTGPRYPMLSPTNCSHAQGACQALTGRPTEGGGNTAKATGPSADVVIAGVVQPGIDPLTLYAGNKRNGYIAERLSFDETGMTRAADDNPYTLYQKLVGLASPGDRDAAELLLESRKSVHDFVREELGALMTHPRLGAHDRMRLEQHFQAIREIEITMGDMGDACTLSGLDVTALEALSSGLAFKMDGMIEDVALLHMSVVATAFACNVNRVATLQWGDGTDHTVYDVPSNAELRWRFHHISHRVQSDSAVGTNADAEEAHAEIDALRLQTFAAGLDHFAARELADRCYVMWTNHLADGYAHSFNRLPYVIWGNAGGYLKQGEFIEAVTNNNQLLCTLINASVRDSGTTFESFGEGPEGELAMMRA
jgi:hypothetical protein